MKRRPALLRALMAVGLAAVVAAPLQAAVPAPADAGTLLTWTGRVDYVSDGDTAVIDIWGDGAGPRAVRNNGIQAMEKGQCHAASATYVFKKLAPAGSKVTMKASKADVYAGGRPLRLVYNAAGVDIQKALLDQGWVLPFTIPLDPINQPLYYRAGQVAASKHLGLFNPARACKAGPYQAAKLHVWVSYDADGDDLANLNGEYIRIYNAGTAAIPIGGWWLRTAAPEIFRFPSTTKVPAGGFVTLHMGKGRATPTHFYWGLSAPKLPNPGLSNLLGSGGFLFDRDGDLRAWAMYPCLYDCTDPAAGKVSLQAVYDPAGDERTNWNLETVRVTNTSAVPVDLSHRVVQYKSWTWEIRTGTVLQPRETFVLHIGSGTQARLVQHWGKPRDILNNHDGAVVLRTTEATTIACDTWGAGTCP